MQLFLDTTDVALLRELAATGMVDGVTTNPSLIAKSGRNMAEVIAEICAVVEGPVSAEVAGPTRPRWSARASTCRRSPTTSWSRCR
jgi:transaldolase